MADVRKLFLECAKALDAELPGLGDDVRRLADLPPNRAFEEYLKLVDKVARLRVSREKRNVLLMILWRYGAQIEECIVPPQFRYFKIRGRPFRLVDSKLVAFLFIVFFLFPAIISSLWSFNTSYTIAHPNEPVTFSTHLCSYRLSWLYDFRAAMVCVIKEGIGEVYFNLGTSDPFEASRRIQAIISRIPYDMRRLKFSEPYIQTPEETLRRNMGVCSDFAILGASVLLHNNVSPVYIVHTVFRGDETGGHAAMAIYYNGTLWVFDWGSKSVPFEDFINTMGKYAEIEEVRIYELTGEEVRLVTVYRARRERDWWRYIYALTIFLGIAFMKRKEWKLI
ncbi:transglutaminase-like domain-containing protein [Pyrococcus yayanosii]|nr:transglutaminase-like domain-containing protein [Pyrococcus yayanosii]